VLLFTPIVIVGIFNAPDYGMAWDEMAQLEIGTVSYNYLFQGDQKLNTYYDADYGVGFELPLIILEKVLGLEESRQIFEMRHLVSHLFFILCLFCGFWLTYKLFGSVWIAIVGVLFFVLHPVIYAHSFFNTKDIPFMGAFLICFLIIQYAFQSYRYTHFALLGAALGYLVNLRLMGLLLLMMVVVFVIADYVRHRKHFEYKWKILRSGLIMLLAFGAMLYFSWPYLHESPYDKFVGAFKNMSRFRLNVEVLYFGEMVSSTQLPWHYIPVWMSITTPLFYLALAITGMVLALIEIFKRPAEIFNNDIRRHLEIYTACFILPIVAVIMINSVLYDSWRHLFFVYPPLVMLALYGLSKIETHRARYLVIPVLIVTFAASLAFMISNHPHQHVYFNALLSTKEENNVRHQFEMDYWGVSYLFAIEEVLRVDKSEQIPMKFSTRAGKFTVANMLSEKDQRRIIITEDHPKYFITGYRFHPEDYSFPEAQEIYSIKVRNNTILSVFKLYD